MLVVCVYCNDAAMTNHPPHRNDHDTNHNYHSITPTAHSTAPTSAPAAQPVNAAKVNRHSVILIFVIIQQVFWPSRPSCSRTATVHTLHISDLDLWLKSTPSWCKNHFFSSLLNIFDNKYFSYDLMLSKSVANCACNGRVWHGWRIAGDATVVAASV